MAEEVRPDTPYRGQHPAMRVGCEFGKYLQKGILEGSLRGNVGSVNAAHVASATTPTIVSVITIFYIMQEARYCVRREQGLGDAKASVMPMREGEARGTVTGLNATDPSECWRTPGGRCGGGFDTLSRRQ
jgi:hypothetical protein